MTVTKESEGRLNAFAKEPEMEVIDSQSIDSNGSRALIIAGVILLIALIAFSFTLK
tara:strand:+ start:110 stop:277 length:168 start_codon:yes stop_codon:yes gene_type:complete